MKTIEVEEAVSRMFGVRQNIVVPNVSWGLNLHECDLLIVRQSGLAVEVEIKVSRADLRKDLEKRHGHQSNKIKEFYYAVPLKLLPYCVEIAPAHAGIIAVYRTGRGKYDGEGRSIFTKAQIKRKPVKNKLAKPLTQDEIYQAARLGTMRIWDLKRKLMRHEGLGGEGLDEFPWFEQPMEPATQALKQKLFEEFV